MEVIKIYNDMKKLFFVAGVAAVMMMSCGGNQEKLNEDSAKIAELTSEYNEATSFNDSLMLLMGDIYSGLDSINTQEGLLYGMNQGDNVDRRAEVRQNLANIRARLAANKELLSQLEAKVKSSNNENSVLAKTIDRLKAYIASQDDKIAKLESDLNAAKGEIANLNNQVAETQEQVRVESAAKEEAQQQAVEAENVANICYYAMGTNKELKQNHILEKKFLGATKVLQGDFNSNYFTKADKRTLTTLRTNSKKVEIVSNMPADSYQIIEGADGMQVIQITNPSKFWSRTPYLVVQLK